MRYLCAATLFLLTICSAFACTEQEVRVLAENYLAKDYEPTLGDTLVIDQVTQEATCTWDVVAHLQRQCLAEPWREEHFSISLVIQDLEVVEEEWIMNSPYYINT